MRFLIVDGHSAIFAWPELRLRHGQRGEAGREALIRVLRGYQDSTGERVVVVFDGAGQKLSETSEPAGIQVFYSPAKMTADAIVERLVAKYASEHEITVATNDLLERQTALTFGALTISIEELRSRLGESRRDLDRQIKALRRKR